MNRQTSLEDRIRTALANPLGSDALMELIQEVETAAAAADAAAVSARTDINDLVRCPDPDAARDRLVEAETRRDRLAAARKPLRDALATSLAAEEEDRWSSDYRNVEQRLESAVEVFKEIPQHMQAIVDALALAAELGPEVSRINGSAPDGIDRRLRPVELIARGMRSFSRDQPSLATTVVLPDWNHSSRTTWPPRPSTSLAATYAELMMTVPHPGGAWADPAITQQRRIEVAKAKRELGEHYRVETEKQTQRLNREERERFAQMNKRS